MPTCREASRPQEMTDIDTFDVVIIGGGPAGCATALTLLKNTARISCLVIDDANPTTFKIGESLPPESARLLHYLHPTLPQELSAQVAAGVHTKCAGNASAWSSPSLEERHAILNPFGHALHLNRAEFEELLRNKVEERFSKAQSRFSLQKVSFKSIRKGAEGIWLVGIETMGWGREIFARWVVDGTGRKASGANKIGVRSVCPDPLLAFYAVFSGADTDDPHSTLDNDTRTLIEATPDGWWYTSLITHSPPTRVVVFHTLPSHPAAKASRRADDFLGRLHDTTSHISRIITESNYDIAPTYPRCTAAGSSHLERVCDAAERWVAVGDAAVAFDPLSSQGMMTALEMGIYVGLKLSEVLESGSTEESFQKDVVQAYLAVQKEYEKNRRYYYSVVKRFQGQAFWDAVIDVRDGL